MGLKQKFFATFCFILCIYVYREEAIRLHVFKIKKTIISYPLLGLKKKKSLRLFMVIASVLSYSVKGLHASNTKLAS